MTKKEAKDLAKRCGVPFGSRWVYAPGIIVINTTLRGQGLCQEAIEDYIHRMILRERREGANYE